MKIPRQFLVKDSKENLHPCPACGFNTLEEICGSFEICRICGWENDPVQLFQLDYRGGANSSSMIEWQQELICDHPADQKAWGEWLRASDWRPINAVDVAKGPAMKERYVADALNAPSESVSC
ncbi:hypothetical protein KDL29_07055 [bacterium]|nr:hypothetical protein [bacterium]